jgi:demethylmenaquinone methyltransferase/2-methoxy-6-polyprenyl-1,4-benzoquinol methylase
MSLRYPPVADLDAQERIRVVKDIFTTAHQTYDLANHVLSFRRDLGWRRAAVRRMRFFDTRRFLDVATGTADLAIEVAGRHPEVLVTGVDFAEPMLDVGRRKVERRGLAERVSLAYGDALDLPFPDGHFDVSAMAFGLRNIPDKARALREMSRVTAAGGQVMILEMTFAPSPIFRSLYRFYLTKTLPSLARLVVGNAAPYYYLADSILKFPPPLAFDEVMRGSGLLDVEHFALTFGTAYIHIGRAPSRAKKGS